MMNPHDGKVLLSHDGRTLALQFSWGVIEEIRAEWGDEYAARMEEAMVKTRLPDIAFIVSKAGDMPATEVMAWSPPIAVTSGAINQAWQRAWFGAEKPARKEASENPPKALPVLTALSGLRFKLPFVRGSAGESSGA